MLIKSHRNALGNSKNIYQGEAKRVLTVCSAGLLRSPTAARLLQETYGFNCRAAGMVEEYALVPVTEVLAYWADEIVFMEDSHLWDFQREFLNSPISEKMQEEGNYQVLNIPDNFDYWNEELKELILEKYLPDVV